MKIRGIGEKLPDRILVFNSCETDRSHSVLNTIFDRETNFRKLVNICIRCTRISVML